MEWFGWVCTVLVLAGFIPNAKRMYLLAIFLWIIGDIGWVFYDIYIHNMSHGFLSAIIVVINFFALYNLKKNSK